MLPWQEDALAAGFDLDAVATVAELVARGVFEVDGPPLEELPGFWVIPGFVPYDGHTILATVDRRHARGATDAARQLTTILGRAVADCAAHLGRGTAPLAPPRAGTFPE